MGEENVGLTVRELLKQAYSILVGRHDPQIIALEAIAEIANDFDYHRMRIGHMGYAGAGLFQFDGKSWAIARGVSSGRYPSDKYDSDILALEFAADGKTYEQMQKELKSAIRNSSYFINTIVCGMADGSLSLDTKARFCESMHKILKKLEIERFIAQQPEYDTNLLVWGTFRHPVIKVAKYKPEFADFLADSIEAVLR